jgi:RNA ligase (TIGR02306 family)
MTIVNTERKLVTIRKIDAIEPIPNADAIEAVVIGGWKVVSKKNEFQIGENAVYFEIDSFLPEGNPAWQFLVDKSSRIFNGVKGHRLRTIRLRGVYSQGFVSKDDNFPEVVQACEASPDVYAEDFSQVLGVTKWEPPELPANLAGQVEGVFPPWMRKSDQERCQNISRTIFDHNTDSSYEVSMKLDGSSCTTFVKDGEVGVCSRNFQLKINEENSDNNFVSTFLNSKLDQALLAFHNDTGRNIAVQSELLGPGIQGNREKQKGFELYVYNIFDIDKQEFVAPEERMNIFNTLVKTATIKHVPILHNGVTLGDLNIHDVGELLKFAEGPSIVHPIREGLVFKRVDGQFSFKAISNLFLEKEKD